jgi:hypothetical protein
LRQQLTDYLGVTATNVELICTENNSVSSGPGKQTTSLVNGLFRADSFGQILQTEFNALVWWDLRNGQDAGNNNSPLLYGWRQYGDYGFVNGTVDRYPTFYVSKLLKVFTRGGDRVVPASTDYPLLAAFAAKRTNGTLSMLVINKSSSTVLNSSVSLTGYSPGSNALVYSYGIPQDEAARTGLGSPDIALTNFTTAGANFAFDFTPYSVTVLSLQPGAPRLAPVAMQPNGEFTLRLQGEPGASYAIEISPDLAAWSRTTTNTLTNATFDFTDVQAVNSTHRFYRAVWIP